MHVRVFRWNAIIPNQRIRKHQDLTLVRGISERFHVTYHASLEDALASHAGLCSERESLESRSILQNEHRFFLFSVCSFHVVVVVVVVIVFSGSHCWQWQVSLQKAVRERCDIKRYLFHSQRQVSVGVIVSHKKESKLSVLFERKERMGTIISFSKAQTSTLPKEGRKDLVSTKPHAHRRLKRKKERKKEKLEQMSIYILCSRLAQQPIPPPLLLRPTKNRKLIINQSISTRIVLFEYHWIILNSHYGVTGFFFVAFFVHFCDSPELSKLASRSKSTVCNECVDTVLWLPAHTLQAISKLQHVSCLHGFTHH